MAGYRGSGVLSVRLTGLDPAAAMAAVPAFASVSSTALEDLAAQGAERRLAKGAVLFNQGDPADHLFVLLEGRVEISSVSADGRRLLHTSVLPSQLFGELEALAGEPRMGGATALDPSIVWVVDTERFRAFLDISREASRAIITALAQQAVASGALLDDLRGLDLRGRLAKRLISLVTPSFDRLPPDGTAIPPIVTQSDLASLASGSREQITRILSDWQRAGIVSRQGRRVTLDDVGALARLAGLR